jgi:hypothetical protein
MKRLSLFCITILLTFFSFNADPLENGLIAYYSFNNCDARDDSGNDSDGILFGKMTCVCGVEGDGLELDGIQDYIEFHGKVNNYFTTSDFTISYYFKTDKYSIFQQSMLSKRATCEEINMLDIQLNINQRFVDTDLYENPRKYFRDISPELDSTVWMYFALVREGIRAKTFINGQLRQEGMRCSGVDLTNDAILSFGNSPCIRGRQTVRFKGVLDELKVYDRALTAEEIMDLYNRTPVENAEIDCVTFKEKKSETRPSYGQRSKKNKFFPRAI